MFRILSKFLYSILKIFDKVCKLIFKRSFLIWFKDFLENDAYIKIKLADSIGNVKLFSPNYLTTWMYNEFNFKEPETIEWINSFKNDHSSNDNIVFWDIGSNLGTYALYAAIKHKNISVVSFEPSTSNLRILTRNIYINNLQNKIRVVQTPLYDKPLSFSLFKESFFGEGESNNTYNYEINFEGKEIIEKNSYNILGLSLDYLVDNKILDMPDFIKIDVDGIEDKILDGFSKHLKDQKIKSIQIEINENFESQKKKIFKIMEKNNFNFKTKKRNEKLNIYRIEKFKKTFNYYFEKQN